MAADGGRVPKCFWRPMAAESPSASGGRWRPMVAGSPSTSSEVAAATGVGIPGESLGASSGLLAAAVAVCGAEGA
eukprot:2653511-Heterocapsa_arctica.AAC.1